MARNSSDNIRKLIDDLYRTESRRVLATLIRLLGDFELAEDAMHEAFSAAMEQWQKDGIPKSPRAWLVSAGRFKAIDQIRRRAKFETPFEPLAEQLADSLGVDEEFDDDKIEDDRLRLVFTCCHPALSPEARVALTLREVCGLTTEEIAGAFLTTPSTMAQRIVRAKSKIREARIPYKVPSRDELPERLDTVLQVVYLIFNEGYSASSGDSATRADLSDEAIRLARLLLTLLPETEVKGLLALMLLHESRRTARTSPSGDIVLLDEQDRSLWNRDTIREGVALVEQALSSPPVGPYAVQAAIAAVHAEAQDASSTDWTEIVELYGILMRLIPSPVVELNRAVAVAMRDGPEAGLRIIDDILIRGELKDYHLAHSARAELCRRLGKTEEAKTSYERALSLARQEPEKRFLERRLNELDQSEAHHF
ncbi:MAG TPA: RNA polymerase sigma factor [Candidatus Acidoferrales bacterium]|nr:RNA polymerase sigma factor [Candidatus Acidoferrales bacterium]